MKLGNGGARRQLSVGEYDRKFRKLTWANVLLALIDPPKVRFFDQRDDPFRSGGGLLQRV
jgi:hypothetical protein